MQNLAVGASPASANPLYMGVEIVFKHKSTMLSNCTISAVWRRIGGHVTPSQLAPDVEFRLKTVHEFFSTLDGTEGEFFELLGISSHSKGFQYRCEFVLGLPRDILYENVSIPFCSKSYVGLKYI